MSPQVCDTKKSVIPKRFVVLVLKLAAIINPSTFHTMPHIPTFFWSSVDGGNLENFGFISLLRRRVRRCVVFVNTCDPIQYPESDSRFQGFDKAVTSLFGDGWLELDCRVFVTLILTGCDEMHVLLRSAIGVTVT